jgi:hypothetical protein
MAKSNRSTLKKPTGEEQLSDRALRDEIGMCDVEIRDLEAKLAEWRSARARKVAVLRGRPCQVCKKSGGHVLGCELSGGPVHS